MEKEMLVVAKLKEGTFEKFMGFMQSPEGLAERAKVAVVEKTIGTVTPDKSTVMFKIFCIDEAALNKIIEGSWEHPRTVVIRFPSYEMALEWYNSKEYEPIKKIRLENAQSNGIIIKGA